MTRTIVEAWLRGETYDETETFRIGSRAGCRSGYFTKAGRIWQVMPATTNPVPLGEREVDVTEECVRSHVSRLKSQISWLGWCVEHHDLYVALSEERVSVHAWKTHRKGAKGLNAPAIGGGDKCQWRREEQKLVGRLRNRLHRFGYEVELVPHEWAPSDINISKR